MCILCISVDRFATLKYHVWYKSNLELIGKIKYAALAACWIIPFGTLHTYVWVINSEKAESEKLESLQGDTSCWLIYMEDYKVMMDVLSEFIVFGIVPVIVFTYSFVLRLFIKHKKSARRRSIPSAYFSKISKRTSVGSNATRSSLGQAISSVARSPIASGSIARGSNMIAASSMAANSMAPKGSTKEQSSYDRKYVCGLLKIIAIITSLFVYHIPHLIIRILESNNVYVSDEVRKVQYELLYINPMFAPFLYSIEPMYTALINVIRCDCSNVTPNARKMTRALALMDSH